nr:GTPase domain-containing protein [Cellulomonas sp. APG4]
MGAAVTGRLGPASPTLLDAVTDLRRDVAATEFVLPLPGVEEAEDSRRRLLDQLDDHLLPRLRELSAPGFVVVAGSTGAGKSTLVNSLLGTEVSAAGVLRPTTRRPVLVHHPDDGDLLAGHPLLEIVEVVAHDGVPRGLVVVDAPDLDSLLESNRSTAHRLLESADLWLFVTTAARYGDALPWSVLDRAHERGTSMAMVLNRVPDAALVEVRGDLLGRLRARGMSSVPLFLVPDLGPHEGMLDARHVAPVRRWLAMVAGPDRARSVIARTQRGALRALRPWVDELADGVQAQADARTALEGLVRESVDEPAHAAADAVRSGGAGDGPVRSRWAAGQGVLDGRWGRRRRAARREALGAVDAEVRGAVEVALATARGRGHAAVRHALGVSGLAGAAWLLDRLPSAPAQDDVAAQVEEWAGGAAAQAALADAGDRHARRRYARLATSAGPDGVSTLVRAAAVGLPAARRVLDDGLGSVVVEDLVRATRDDLAARASAQARAAADEVLGPLGHAELADDAASRLRLRLAVLKGLA